jgi:hypothetical protein
LWQKRLFGIKVELASDLSEGAHGMENTLPLRIFYHLSEIEATWGVARSELHQWLQQGALRAHVWLPLSSLYQIEEEIQGSRIIQTKTLCHRGGYLQILAHDCQRLIHEGKTFVREFGCHREEQRFAFPETVPSMAVQLENLVILSEERLRFEEVYQLSSQSWRDRTDSTNKPPLLRFRKITFHGQEYTFGTIQASVLGILFESARNGDSWMNGKQLLAKAGSLSFSVSNLFKRKPGWRTFINSDGLGNYRLDPSLLETLKEE